MTYIPKIKNNRLGDDAVTTDKILDGEVMTDDLALDAVTGNQIADDAVGSEHIQDSAVGESELADEAVTNAKIGPDAVDGDKIADDAVGSEHIQMGAVGSDEIAAEAVGESELADGAVTNAKLGADAVDGTKLADDAVGSEHIAAGAVDNSELANGAVNNAKVAADAAIELSKLATDPLARENHTGTQLASTISDFDTQVQTNSLDEMAAPEADVDMAGHKLTGLAEPTLDDDAATKGYVDSVAMGLDVKASVRVASQGDLDLSGPGASVDGVTLANGDRVLVKAQAAGEENGIYVFNGSASAMTRAEDADSDAEVTAGMFTFVEQGTNADQGWVLTTDNPITLGTTELAFSQFSNAVIVSTLDSLTDVDVTGAGTGALLHFNGTEWVDSENLTIDDANGTLGFVQGSSVTEDGAGKIIIDSPYRSVLKAAGQVNVTSDEAQIELTSADYIDLIGTNGVYLHAGVMFNVSEIAGGSLDRAYNGASEFLVLTESGQVFDLPLPEAGRMMIIKNIDGGAEDAPILINGSVDDNFTIDGEYEYWMDTNYQSVTLMSDGFNWYVV